MKYDVIDARISPAGPMEILSKAEVSELLDTSQGGLYTLFRNCSLAVLNSGSQLDDGKELLERYRSFDIRVVQKERGIKLEVKGAPAHAFVDGKMIKGINEHLFAVLRDVIYVSDEIRNNPRFDQQQFQWHHQRGLSYPAQCQYPAADDQSEHGGLLGRAFDIT